MRKGRSAFTLIEVMVSVVIISTVIMALIKLFANNTHIFASLQNKNETSQSLSFMMSNYNYGFNDDEVTLYELVEDFDLESDLKRELKETKIKLIYQELDKIDMSEFDGTDEENEDLYEEDVEEEVKNASSNLVFEIGKTILKTDDSSAAILRIRLQ